MKRTPTYNASMEDRTNPVSQLEEVREHGSKWQVTE